jgi:hypothetical protein
MSRIVNDPTERLGRVRNCCVPPGHDEWPQERVLTSPFLDLML